MDEVEVYRVAHPMNDGRGPYCGYGPGSNALIDLAWKMQSTHLDDDHPAPEQEGITRFAGFLGDRCGFSSVDKLYDWFEGWLAQLDEAGYELRTYRVNRRHVRAGLKQVVFDITQAQHVATSRLVEVAA